MFIEREREKMDNKKKHFLEKKKYKENICN